MNEDYRSLIKEAFEAIRKLKHLKKNRMPVAEGGLKFDEYVIIDFVHDLTRDDAEHSQGVKISTLSKETNLATPIITNYVSNLERRGYVTRTHGRDDRRVVRVNLTEKSIQMVNLRDDNFAKEIKDLIKFIGVEKARQFIDTVNLIFVYMTEKNCREDKK